MGNRMVNKFQKCMTCNQYSQQEIAENATIYPDQIVNKCCEKPKLKIQTRYHVSEVEMADNKENALKNINLKYNCPICFRYFNRILKTTCCKNYVCLHCTNDMNKIECYNKKISCPYCVSSSFYLVDVKKHEKIKTYTDSPFQNIQFQSQNNSILVQQQNLVNVNDFNIEAENEKQHQKNHINILDCSSLNQINIDQNKNNPIEENPYKLFENNQDKQQNQSNQFRQRIYKQSKVQTQIVRIKSKSNNNQVVNIQNIR